MPDAPEKEKKGFAGFDSLLSDVEQDISRAKSIPGPTQVASEGGQHAGPAQDGAKLPKLTPIPAEAWGGGGQSKVFLWVGIGAVLVVIFGVSQWGAKPAAVPALTRSETQPRSGPAATVSGASKPTENAPAVLHYSPPPAYVTPRPEQPAGWIEERPPVGTDQLLGYLQVRYCVAEEIRLKAMQGLINKYSGREVDAFNVLIADYNSRCGTFRYSRGSLEAIEQDADKYRTTFIEAARKRVSAWR